MQTDFHGNTNFYGIFNEMAKVCSNNFPTLRIGQFISNFTAYLERNGKDIFYISNDEILDYLNSFAEFHKQNGVRE